MGISGDALLLLLLLGTASADCNSGCESYCSSSQSYDDCLLKCRASCDTAHSVEDPYFQLVEVKNLYQDYPITGCDGHREPPFRELYCVSLHGRVYKIDGGNNAVSVVHSMPSARLFISDNCGLYDIFFDADFHHNRHLYLYHAMHDNRADVHHTNVVSMYRLTQSGELHFLHVVRAYEQDVPTQHAWAKMDLRMYVTMGPAPVLLTNPGNPHNDPPLRLEMPYLSAISAFYVNESEAAKQLVMSGAVKEYLWATGLGDPITCSRTRYLAEHVMCLSKVDEQTLIYSARRSGEYSCPGDNFTAPRKLCEERIFANLTGGCPVEYLVYYTGKGSLKPTRLLSRSACYRDGAFHPAEILKLYEPKYDRLWSTVSVRTQTHDGMNLALTNTIIMTADRFNKLYIGGYSLRDNNYYIYEMNRLKKLY